MNNNARFYITWPLALLLAGGLALAALNQNGIRRLRAECRVRLSEQAEADRLARENQRLPALRVEMAEVDKLREANAELPYLRNQATQLHTQASELESLRTQHNRLAADSKRISGQSNGNPVQGLPLDFVSRNAIRDAGLATPEATLRTFFWSMTQGNISRLQQCGIPGTMMDLPESANMEDLRAVMIKDGEKILGYRIFERKDVSVDEVVLGVQAFKDSPSSANPEAMTLTARLVGNEWKLDLGKR